MAGNWGKKPSGRVSVEAIVWMLIALSARCVGQHALVDEVDPTSDFRSSITLLDIAVRTSSICQMSSVRGFPS